ncbi:hypothetical protein GJ496_007416 [Pomphorhynchus laevis]|nr:hypothetical protein GJ496_007416 [Pomphorhynchus laevis]
MADHFVICLIDFIDFVKSLKEENIANRMQCHLKNLPLYKLLENDIKLAHNADKIQNRLAIYFYRPYPVPQCGPRCGISAIKSALNAFNLSCTMDEITMCAVKMGFSKQGELFEADHVVKLLKAHGTKSNLCSWDVFSKRSLIKELQSCKLCLVPYDCSSNGEPCNLAGSKAHWACVFGYCENDSYQHHVKDQNNFDNVVLLVVHGKSNRTRVWYYDQLWSSNQQLFSPSKKLSTNEYMLPKKNLKHTLASRFVSCEVKENN